MSNGATLIRKYVLAVRFDREWVICAVRNMSALHAGKLNKAISKGFSKTAWSED